MKTTTQTCCYAILFVALSSIVMNESLAAEANERPRQPADDKLGKHGEPVVSDLPQVGHPTFLSPHASPILLLGDHVFAVNTPSDTVDVISTSTHMVIEQIPVGVDPVSIAARPDGKEVWVSNHVSDSVSVIDTDNENGTYLRVIDTIQAFNEQTRGTDFDEPVGIAFASNEKAYVALSTDNAIAVVDVKTREITNRLRIPAQDPRAIQVRNGRLYVIPFESNNQTQLSGGTGELDGELVTFNAFEHAIANNNVLSLGAVLDIVKHPRVPDRDLFIFDTKTDQLLQTVDGLGTLLYGMAVDSQGRIFIAQTDARNDVNGRSGTKKHGLAELENRAFLNRITSVDPASVADRGGDPVGSADETTTARASGSEAVVEFIDLEPLPPKNPEPDSAFATPFAIQISADDQTLVATAAGSDKLFTVDVSSGDVLGQVALDAVPRGVALQSDKEGRPKTAWVLNAVANSVAFVDLTHPERPVLVDVVALDDPTHPAVKRGRIAFNTASASTTKTFACASCHPDGHTDQLLWVLKTPVVTGGDQIMPRSTMPVRGLRDTAPFHWDGIPGDPYGGNNSANVHGSDPPNSKVEDPASATRHLIDGGLAATMSLPGDTEVNDEGKGGALSAAERDDMATFLLSVPYPPAQRRPYTDVVSDRAKQGFRLFHIDGDNQGKPTPNVCGDCHRMPFLVSTNTPGSGMDAPTWRGAYDRFLILPQGRLNIIDFDFYREIAERGIPERNMWQFSWAGRRRFDPVWDMVLEGSTGYSGAFARQVTLQKRNAKQSRTTDLLDALEQSARDGGILLQVEGVLLDPEGVTKVAYQFHDVASGDASDTSEGVGRYVHLESGKSKSRDELVALATQGRFIGTFSGRHGERDDVENPQPALWTRGPLERQRGRQRFPIVYPGHASMEVSGRHFEEDANLYVDGRRVSGAIEIAGEDISIELDALPASGLHLLQVQSPQGMFSNDFLFHVVENSSQARELDRRTEERHTDRRAALANAAAQGRVDWARRLIDRGVDINQRNPEGGSTPLSEAALRGNIEMVQLLLNRGAKVDATNRDGNTPLHVAAFMGRFGVVELLLEAGAKVESKNGRGETSSDVVSGEWSDGLGRFYVAVSNGINQEIDLEKIQRKRTRMLERLRRRPSGDAK